MFRLQSGIPRALARHPSPHPQASQRGGPTPESSGGGGGSGSGGSERPDRLPQAISHASLSYASSGSVGGDSVGRWFAAVLLNPCRQRRIGRETHTNGPANLL